MTNKEGAKRCEKCKRFNTWCTDCQPPRGECEPEEPKEECVLSSKEWISCPDCDEVVDINLDRIHICNPTPKPDVKATRLERLRGPGEVDEDDRLFLLTKINELEGAMREILDQWVDKDDAFDDAEKMRDIARQALKKLEEDD